MRVVEMAVLGGLLCGVVSCAAPKGEAEAEVKAGPASGPRLEAALGIRWGHEAGNGGTLTVHPHPRMVGLCAQQTNVDGSGNAETGSAQQVGAAPMSFPIPPGTVSTTLGYFEWETPDGRSTTPVGPGSSPASGRAMLRPPMTYEYWTVPVLPNSSGAENVTSWMRVPARSLDRATARRLGLEERIERILEGGMPLPLPQDIDHVAFWSWRIGPGGDLWLTVGGPGTVVEDFQVDVNGVTAYATLGNGATVTDRGDWQVVHVLVPGEDLNVSATPGVWHENAVSVRLRTDRLASFVDDRVLRYRVDP